MLIELVEPLADEPLAGDRPSRAPPVAVVKDSSHGFSRAGGTKSYRHSSPVLPPESKAQIEYDGPSLSIGPSEGAWLPVNFGRLENLKEHRAERVEQALGFVLLNMTEVAVVR